jgi:hypothetical protein
MIADESLGIVAPAQLIIDERAGVRVLANRVFWDLESVSFSHDFRFSHPGTPPFDYLYTVWETPSFPSHGFVIGILLSLPWLLRLGWWTF